LVLIFRYLITYFPRARTSTHPKKITLEKEQLAEIHGGTWEQLSVFQHIERGLQKNPDKPAVVCLFPQSAGLNALVATCVSQQGKLSNGYQDDTCTEPPKLWSKDRRQTAIANESDQESPQSPTSNESTEIFTLSYNELHRMALRLAAGLVLHGAQPNTTMLMLIPNGAEYAILLWVCALLRITYVNLDPAYLDISGFTALKGLLQTIKPQIVVTPDTIGGKVIDVAISELELPQPIRVCLSDSVTSPKWRSFATIVTGSKLNGDVDEDALVLAARHDRTPNRINSIMFTSGTSGLPKGCPQSVSAISYALHSQEWLIDPESGTANFALMQPHNSRGIAPAQTLQTWRAGGAVVLTGQTFR
jgi:4-coumarate--CoA ligase